MLGEAYVLNDDIDKADATVAAALEVSAQIHFVMGVGLSKQAMGRIAGARGARVEAKHHLEEAIALLSAVGARFELARCHLEVASISDPKEAVIHLEEARALFAALNVPKYVARTDVLSEPAGKALRAYLSGWVQRVL
jgi:hypothetical protein